MREVTIKITKCGKEKVVCPYSREPRGWAFCTHPSRKADGGLLYEQNRDGITPSCPMYSESVEVAE